MYILYYEDCSVSNDDVDKIIFQNLAFGNLFMNFSG